ncbi:MAG: DUF2807 domain-containing protein [Bacteroidales bacterium]|nr:DUF2807 domain-containing protein [Bacteroidales bacterium]
MKATIRNNFILFFVLTIFVFHPAITVSQTVRGNGNVVVLERNAEDFTGIVAKGKFDLKITQGNSNKIEVKTDENLQKYILADLKKDIITITVPEIIKKAKALEIIITVKNLKSLIALGSVNIFIDSLKTDKADIFLSGMCDLNINIFCNELIFEISDVGSAILSGKTDIFNARITDEANLDAFELVSNKCDLKTSGYSDVRVNVKDELTLRTTGIGNIYYKGNPVVNNTINSGTTFIIKRKSD